MSAVLLRSAQRKQLILGAVILLAIVNFFRRRRVHT
jgi:hypothetical protein